MVTELLKLGSRSSFRARLPVNMDQGVQHICKSKGILNLFGQSESDKVITMSMRIYLYPYYLVIKYLMQHEPVLPNNLIICVGWSLSIYGETRKMMNYSCTR